MPMNLGLSLGLSSRATASGGGGGNVAPVITGVPTISGTAGLGDVLTASPASVTGTPSPTRTWQWYRDAVAISGATGSTHTIVSADQGTDITVQQIETNVAGSDDATSLATSIPAAFTPADLFTTGIEGQWAKVDIADLWQDTARTTPVTAAGDPVASWRVNTSSGVTYMEQGTSANRPIYRENGNGAGYLEFDGSNDSLQTGSLAGPSGSAASTIMVAVDFDGTASDNKGFACYHPNFSANARHRALAMDASQNLKADTGGVGNSVIGGAIPSTFAVLEANFGGGTSCAIDGGTLSTGGAAAASLTPQVFIIGRALTANYAAGKYYGFVHIVDSLTSGERADLVAWLGALENP